MQNSTSSSTLCPCVTGENKNEKHEKLIFPLYKSCAREGSVVPVECLHLDADRALVGEWTTEEVKLALEKEYKMLKIYEVWHFDHTINLFHHYIEAFMKLKLQSSPYTGTKEEYAAEIKAKMGIELGVDKINPNPALRTIAKLCMNSVSKKDEGASSYK